MSRQALIAAITLAAVVAGGPLGAQVPVAAVLGATAASPTATLAESYRALRVSQVIGMGVRNLQGDGIGRVEDLVLNIRTGHVRYVVLRFDPGTLDAGRLYPVPVGMLRLEKDGDDVILPLSPARLKRASIRAERWNEGDLAASEEIRRVDAAWGLVADPGPLVRAGDVIGETIVNAGGARIGEMEELVMNAPAGRVHYAVAALDPAWLTTGKRVALPLRSLRRFDTTGPYQVEIDPADAQALPAFDPERYVSLSDQDFLRELERHLLVAGTLASAAQSAGPDDAGRPVGS